MGAENFSRNPYQFLVLENTNKNREALRDIADAINDSQQFWMAVKVEVGYHEDIRLQIDLSTIPAWVDDEDTPDGYGQIWGSNSDWELCDPMTREEFDTELTRQIKAIELAIEIAMLQFGKSAREYVLVENNKGSISLVDGGATFISIGRINDRLGRYLANGKKGEVRVMSRRAAFDRYPKAFSQQNKQNRGSE